MSERSRRRTASFVFSVTLAIANYRAKQKWRRELVAPAKVVS